MSSSTAFFFYKAADPLKCPRTLPFCTSGTDACMTRSGHPDILVNIAANVDLLHLFPAVLQSQTESSGVQDVQHYVVALLHPMYLTQVHLWPAPGPSETSRRNKCLFESILASMSLLPDSLRHVTQHFLPAVSILHQPHMIRVI